MTLCATVAGAVPSPLARRDARWRLAAFVVFIAGCAALRTPAAAGLAVASALGAAAVGRVPAGVLAGRVGLLVLSAAPLLLLGPLTSPDYAILPTVAVLLRLIAVGVAGLTLAHAAPLSDTLAAAEALGVPAKLVQVARLAVRYAVLLAAEARRTRVALRTRGFAVRTARHSYRTLGYTVGALLVRADDRAERVADAMCCRGFAGQSHSTATPRTDFGDVMLFAAAVALTTVVVMSDRLALSRLGTP